MKVELGVTDQTYGDDKTTGEIAQYLENKYGIIQAFVNAHKVDIQRALERSMVNAFEEQAQGLPARNMYASGLQEIQVMMKRWLSTQEVEKVGLPGVPTQAALLGKSSRFKSGLNRVSMKQKAKGVRVGVRRPSFIDTGLYQASLRAWENLHK